ncbi:putative RNA recognition motif domain, nucleotide-binding alpha-beta plait domain superfamily [Helianthus annuus]|nr:putative RNA recognition motif domain, nucleotide-binding alpha-beta plait domain superfamily [Helianthus annuus]KAJ0784597.1 putative RNA recognition motif domain, nucleotide-binding alpha-beta plait domain superfamily [Helianthus annuus]KAJ0793840.1 putative RNA recognition motif domain, nucleotide-binding alpha-beta plait domain superfamily [Helianthus annuus]KAJ0958434.1 putative RNA recognition motif domain, nucleotide-binding alpha-beta plait domain superfamily [Helianthus annuus]
MLIIFLSPRKKSFIKKPRDQKVSENSNVVYVGNLSWNVDNETLETLFSEHGNVMQAKVFYDKDSGRSRGFGFVTYTCADEVYSALKSLRLFYKHFLISLVC